MRTHINPYGPSPLGPVPHLLVMTGDAADVAVEAVGRLPPHVLLPLLPLLQRRRGAPVLPRVLGLGVEGRGLAARLVDGVRRPLRPKDLPGSGEEGLKRLLF